MRMSFRDPVIRPILFVVGLFVVVILVTTVENSVKGRVRRRAIHPLTLRQSTATQTDETCLLKEWRAPCSSEHPNEF